MRHTRQDVVERTEREYERLDRLISSLAPGEWAKRVPRPETRDPWTVKDAIATLEALFATWGQPSTSNLPRQRARLAGGAFNLMGAAYGAKGVHGLKAYAGVKGAQYHTLLYSSLDGKLKAMIEADLFGQMRTGAASGVATKLLANADAHTLAVIGTGKQSRTQIAAVCAVRPITRAAPVDRSSTRPRMNGPRSLMVTTTLRSPWVTRSLVPNGRLRWAAVMALAFMRWPEAVRLPDSLP